MRKLFAFAMFTGLSFAASRAAAQGKPLGFMRLSDPAPPVSERSSHEYDCGKFGGYKVEFAFENRLPAASTVTRVRVNGRDYTRSVNAADDLGDSYLQNPYLSCWDDGVVIGLQAIDRKHPIPRRDVEISINDKTSAVDVLERIESDGLIENGDDAFRRDCDALKHGVPDAASSGIWADPEFRRAFNEASQHSEVVLRAASDSDSVSTRAGRFLAGVVSRNAALVLRSFSPDVGRYLAGMEAPSALTVAASCGDGKGMFLLLDAGADANAGADKDVGAFNIALLRGDNMRMHDILRHGYRLDAGRRCKSSKTILAHSQHPIVPQIARAIEGTTCKSD